MKTTYPISSWRPWSWASRQSTLHSGCPCQTLKENTFQIMWLDNELIWDMCGIFDGEFVPKMNDALDYKTCISVQCTFTLRGCSLLECVLLHLTITKRTTSYKEMRKTSNKPEPLSNPSPNLVLALAISFLDVPKDMSGNSGNASITAFAIYSNIQNEDCNIWNIGFKQKCNKCK